MFKKFLGFLAFLLLMSGCALQQEEPMPEIVGESESFELPDFSQSSQEYSSGIPSSWIPPSGNQRDWRAIIVHHSATDNGNANIFDRWHKEGNGWDGVGYDFVIGNGTNSGNGQVEVTFRWRQQRTGAHCGGTENNWANKYGIGICLVGNFNQYSPTPQQLQSLRKLVRFLSSRYDIPKSRIYGHGQVEGASTDCPGRKFPMARFKRSL
jgi:hypothetical protein